MSLRFNKREVVIPFFVVGEREVNLSELIETIRKALKAQKS